MPYYQTGDTSGSVQARQRPDGAIDQRLVGGGVAAFERARARMLSDHAGELSLDDLAAHESVIRAPVAVDYRGVEVLTQPPSSQAMLLAMALRRLAVSSFDCCGEAITWKRAVAKVDTCFCVGRISGSSSETRDV